MDALQSTQEWNKSSAIDTTENDSLIYIKSMPLQSMIPSRVIERDPEDRLADDKCPHRCRIQLYAQCTQIRSPRVYQTCCTHACHGILDKERQLVVKPFYCCKIVILFNESHDTFLVFRMRHVLFL